ncbi:MAG: hypothetical protein ACQES1_06500 [Bacteroidota bacterium]
MKKQKIYRILLFVLVGFSILFIGTGMLLKKQSLVFDNQSQQTIMLRVRYNDADKDSLYMVKPGGEKIILESSSIQKKNKDVVEKEFLNNLNKFKLYAESGIDIVNLIESKDEWIIKSDKKHTEIRIEFYAKKKQGNKL